MPGSASSASRARIGIRAGRERELSARDRGRERAQRARALAGQADLLERRVGERVGLGEESRRRRRDPRSASGTALAEALGEAAREPRRAGHRDLLAEHDPHRDLERIPRAGHAHAGSAAQPARAAADRRRAAADLAGIGAEIEHRAHALGEREPVLGLGAVRAHLERAARARVRSPRRRAARPATRSARRTRPAPTASTPGTARAAR